MCGRYALYSNIEQIKTHFPIDQVACESEPNYNVAPTQEVLAIVKQDGVNILDKLHWGLVPFWVNALRNNKSGSVDLFREHPLRQSKNV